MIIENGYWNYYISFRTPSSNEAIKAATEKSDYIIAIASGSDLIVSSHLWQTVKDSELYKKDYSFQKCWDDSIEAVTSNSMAANTFFYRSKTIEVFSASIMPLKVNYRNGSYYYCPVIITVFANGYGVMKLAMPLHNVDCGNSFEKYPIKSWFKSVEQCRCDTDSINFSSSEVFDDVIGIRTIMEESLNNTFGEIKYDLGRNYYAFDTIVISDENGDIGRLKQNTKDKRYNEIYHLACPEFFGKQLSRDAFNEFWQNKHGDINGIEYISGNPGRLVLFADPTQIVRSDRKEPVYDYLAYLHSAVSFAFDLAISIAINQKMNEADLYNISSSNLKMHKIRSYIANYYYIKNYYDDLVESAPSTVKEIHKVAKDNIDQYGTSVMDKIKLYEYLEEMASRRRQLTISSYIGIISLFAVVLFGLPSIEDGCRIIGSLLPQGISLFPVLSINALAFVIWLVILILMSVIVLAINKKYRKYKIDE